MNLIMTLLVCNEDDIIEDNIRFHQKMGVDYFIAMDHLSTDSTTDILQSYERQGCLKRIPQTSETYSQGTWVSQMAQMAYSEYAADWVINNDADEFWMPQTGTLKDFFSELPISVGKVHVNRLDYHYRPFEKTKYYDALIFREWLCRWTKCCHRGASDVKVDVGNHNAYSNEISSKYGQEINYGDKIMIHHYPVRSYDRYKAKMAQGGRLVWKTPEISYETSFHWKNALQKIESGVFDEFFSTFVYGQDRLMAGLKDDSVVIDETVQKFFRDHKNADIAQPDRATDL